MNMDVHMIDKYYEEHSVYRSLVVCDSDESAEELTETLVSKDYSVVMVSGDDIDSERGEYMEKISQYMEERMLVISHHTLHKLYPLIQAHVLPHQNLIIFYNIDYNLLRLTTMKCLLESQVLGFLEDVNILSM